MIDRYERDGETARVTEAQGALRAVEDARRLAAQLDQSAQGAVARAARRARTGDAAGWKVDTACSHANSCSRRSAIAFSTRPRPKELLQLLRIPRQDRATVRRHLKALVETGDLIKIRGNRFGLADRMDLVVGRLQTHPRGFGFVTPDTGRDDAGRRLRVGRRT